MPVRYKKTAASPAAPKAQLSGLYDVRRTGRVSTSSQPRRGGHHPLQPMQPTKFWTSSTHRVWEPLAFSRTQRERGEGGGASMLASRTLFFPARAVAVLATLLIAVAVDGPARAQVPEGLSRLFRVEWNVNEGSPTATRVQG